MPSIPRINIEKQAAQIGIKTTNAQMRISSQRPKFRVKNELPQMTVDRKTPGFKVNWQKVRAESGLEGAVSKVQTNAAKTEQHMLEYTSEAAQYGNQLAKIEQGGNRIAQMERQKVLQDDLVEINLGSMPQSMPEIQWDPGYINISWSNTNFQIEWDSDYMPTFSVEPHSVEIYLRNKPYIRITLNEDGVPKSAGRTVDKKI